MPVDTLLNAVVLIVLGAAALFFGLRLFWLFAAVVGFAVGWWLVGLFFKDLGILQVIIGIIVGVILAGLTRWLGGWAIRIVAGLAGFVMLPLLLGNLGMLGGLSELVWSLLGFALGFVLAVFMADWAVIILSALLGARLDDERRGPTHEGIAAGRAIASLAFDDRLCADYCWRPVPVTAEAVNRLTASVIPPIVIATE